MLESILIFNKNKKNRTMEKIELSENIIQASNLLKAVANQNRLSILCILKEDKKSVTQVLEHLNISQPALSQHLSVMKNEQILDFEQKGTTKLYFIKNKSIKKIIKILEQEFCK